MLRIHTANNAQAVENYYTQALSKEDYYTEKGNIIGHWYGKAAKQLGLDGAIKQEQFYSLINNTHPTTGAQLTPRNKADRRIGYDINFHVPKSVSIAYAINQDKEILKAFRSSVQESMQKLEQYTQTSVRQKGASELRTTGNMVYSEFIHFTARPIDGKADPHLHAHCFTFNATFDKEENRFKAIQNESIKKNAPYFQAYFHAALAKKLSDAGYEIKSQKKGWEIAPISQQAIQTFSRRTSQIEQIAKDKGISNEKQKAALGAKTRQNKQTNTSWEMLLADWKNRLPQADKENIKTWKQPTKGQSLTQKPLSSLIKQTALDAFERKSIILETHFKTMALERSVGTHTPQATEQVIRQSGLIKKIHRGKSYFTTPQVLKEQQQMIELAVKGKGRHRAFTNDYKTQVDFLNKDQKKAIQHIHQSQDFITIIQGGAGVGKTTLMKEAVAGIEEKGKKVFAFAPSSQASKEVMRSEGFHNADTVARLLVDEKMQTELKNQVIWIDEAGMLGTRSLNKVMQIAQQKKARIILTGDIKQHASVERGDALRLLQEKAQIASPKVKQILRQKGDYKKAVDSISQGQITKGFKQLNRLGAIQEIKGDNRYNQLAKDYLALAKANKKTLVVAPTHQEGKQLTEYIRKELQENDLLSKRKRMVGVLQKLQLTEGQKSDPRWLEKDLVLQTTQNIKGFARGAKYALTGQIKDDCIELLNDKGGKQYLSTQYAQRFNLYEKKELELAKGDKIRITQNGFGYGANISRKRVDNGSIHQVNHISKKGEIHLSNGTRLAKDFGHYTHGYAITSHAAQGKTVDTVLIAQSAKSFGAANAQQFYVSVSRAKQQVNIYTDDKKGLLKAIQQQQKRTAAIETADTKTALRQQLNRHLSTLKSIYQSAKKAMNTKYQDWTKQIKNNEQRTKTYIKPISKGR